jgi:cell division septum initiation protein DivIVA
VSTPSRPLHVQEGGEAIDVLHLLDRLEEAISTGWKIPFTSRVAVNEQELVELSDSIRSAVPEELRRAQQVLHERDALLAEAEAAAQRLIETAEHHADQLLSEQGLRQYAEHQANLIIDQATKRAQAVQSEADAYALGSLHELEKQLTQTLATVRNGIESLRASESPDHHSDQSQGLPTT